MDPSLLEEMENPYQPEEPRVPARDRRNSKPPLDLETQRWLRLATEGLRIKEDQTPSTLFLEALLGLSASDEQKALLMNRLLALTSRHETIRLLKDLLDVQPFPWRSQLAASWLPSLAKGMDEKTILFHMVPLIKKLNEQPESLLFHGGTANVQPTVNFLENLKERQKEAIAALIEQIASVPVRAVVRVRHGGWMGFAYNQDYVLKAQSLNQHQENLYEIRKLLFRLRRSGLPLNELEEAFETGRFKIGNLPPGSPERKLFELLRQNQLEDVIIGGGFWRDHFLSLPLHDIDWGVKMPLSKHERAAYLATAIPGTDRVLKEAQTTLSRMARALSQHLGRPVDPQDLNKFHWEGSLLEYAGPTELLDNEGNPRVIRRLLAGTDGGIYPSMTLIAPLAMAGDYTGQLYGYKEALGSLLDGTVDIVRDGKNMNPHLLLRILRLKHQCRLEIEPWLFRLMKNAMAKANAEHPQQLSDPEISRLMKALYQHAQDAAQVTNDLKALGFGRDATQTLPPSSILYHWTGNKAAGLMGVFPEGFLLSQLRPALVLFVGNDLAGFLLAIALVAGFAAYHVYLEQTGPDRDKLRGPVWLRFLIHVWIFLLYIFLVPPVVSQDLSFHWGFFVPFVLINGVHFFSDVVRLWPNFFARPQEKGTEQSRETVVQAPDADAARLRAQRTQEATQLSQALGWEQKFIPVMGAERTTQISLYEAGELILMGMLRPVIEGEQVQVQLVGRTPREYEEELMRIRERDIQEFNNALSAGQTEVEVLTASEEPLGRMSVEEARQGIRAGTLIAATDPEGGPPKVVVVRDPAAEAFAAQLSYFLERLKSDDSDAQCEALKYLEKGLINGFLKNTKELLAAVAQRYPELTDAEAWKQSPSNPQVRASLLRVLIAFPEPPAFIRDRTVETLRNVGTENPEDPIVICAVCDAIRTHKPTFVQAEVDLFLQLAFQVLSHRNPRLLGSALFMVYWLTGAMKRGEVKTAPEAMAKVATPEWISLMREYAAHPDINARLDALQFFLVLGEPGAEERYNQALPELYKRRRVDPEAENDLYEEITSKHQSPIEFLGNLLDAGKRAIFVNTEIWVLEQWDSIRDAVKLAKRKKVPLTHLVLALPAGREGELERLLDGQESAEFTELLSGFFDATSSRGLESLLRALKSFRVAGGKFYFYGPSPHLFGEIAFDQARQNLVNLLTNQSMRALILSPLNHFFFTKGDLRREDGERLPFPSFAKAVAEHLQLGWDVVTTVIEQNYQIVSLRDHIHGISDVLSRIKKSFALALTSTMLGEFRFHFKYKDTYGDAFGALIFRTWKNGGGGDDDGGDFSDEDPPDASEGMGPPEGSEWFEEERQVGVVGNALIEAAQAFATGRKKNIPVEILLGDVQRIFDRQHSRLQFGPEARRRLLTYVQNRVKNELELGELEVEEALRIVELLSQWIGESVDLNDAPLRLVVRKKDWDSIEKFLALGHGQGAPTLIIDSRDLEFFQMKRAKSPHEFMLDPQEGLYNGNRINQKVFENVLRPMGREGVESCVFVFPREVELVSGGPLSAASLMNRLRTKRLEDLLENLPGANRVLPLDFMLEIAKALTRDA